MYSAPSHIIHASDLQCVIYLCMHALYINVKYMMYIYNLGVYFIR